MHNSTRDYNDVDNSRIRNLTIQLYVSVYEFNFYTPLQLYQEILSRNGFKIALVVNGV